MSKDLGKVCMAHKGPYDATAEYEALDVVTYEGSSYCCTIAASAEKITGIPPTDTNYWLPVAQKGDKGDMGDEPVITTTKTGTITTIYADGKAIGTISDGAQGNSGVETRDGVQNWNDLSDPTAIPEDTTEYIQTAGAKATATALTDLAEEIHEIHSYDSTNLTLRGNYWVLEDGSLTSGSARLYKLDVKDVDIVELHTASVGTSNTRQAYALYNSEGSVLTTSGISKDAFESDFTVDIDSYPTADFMYIGCSQDYVNKLTVKTTKKGIVKENIEDTVALKANVYVTDFDVTKSTNPAYALRKTDGTFLSSSMNYGYKLSLIGINRVSLTTRLGYFNEQNSVASWLIISKNGELSRTSGAVSRQTLLSYDIDIDDGEEYMYFSCEKDSNVLSITCYTEDLIKDRIEEPTTIDANINLWQNQNDVFESFASLVNSKKVAEEINNTTTLVSEAYNDCSMTFDDNYIYTVGVTNGADVYWSAGTKVKMYIFDKSGNKQQEYIVAEADMSVTCIDGTTVTFAKGASMPGIVNTNSNIYIWFTTMLDSKYVLVRCEVVDNALTNYCVCKLSNGDYVTPTGFANLGYNLYSSKFEDLVVFSVNVNACCANAVYNGDYYIGLCGADCMKYPFILKTSDFETFTVYKQLVQKDCNAAYECTTAVLGSTLYCVTRNNQTGKYKHLTVNEINLTTGEIVKSYVIRGTDSRPCLFKYNSMIYLFYNFGEERYKARVINLTPTQGKQPVIFDIDATLMYIPYSYIQIMDSGNGLYYYTGNYLSTFNMPSTTPRDVVTMIAKLL